MRQIWEALGHCCLCMQISNTYSCVPRHDSRYYTDTCTDVIPRVSLNMHRHDSRRSTECVRRQDSDVGRKAVSVPGGTDKACEPGRSERSFQLGESEDKFTQMVQLRFRPLGWRKDTEAQGAAECCEGWSVPGAAASFCSLGRRGGKEGASSRCAGQRAESSGLLAKLGDEPP